MITEKSNKVCVTGSLQGEYFERWIVALGLYLDKHPSTRPHVSRTVSSMWAETQIEEFSSVLVTEEFLL